MISGFPISSSSFICPSEAFSSTRMEWLPLAKLEKIGLKERRSGLEQIGIRFEPLYWVNWCCSSLLVPIWPVLSPPANSICVSLFWFPNDEEPYCSWWAPHTIRKLSLLKNWSPNLKYSPECFLFQSNSKRPPDRTMIYLSLYPT